MRIWFDVLTPKQVVFFEPMARRLRRRHEVLCTSRRYGEATGLARIRGFGLRVVGRHGGGDRAQKLLASAERVRLLIGPVRRFGPDATVSCCSPEAARVSFGLGVRHYAFTDAPHATAAMRLTVPLLHKVMVPWVVPKSDLTRFGIAARDVIQYRAIDGAQTVMRRAARARPLPDARGKKTILVRPVEEEAAYVSGARPILPAIRELCGIEGARVIVLARYRPQLERLRAGVPRGARVMEMSFDGKHLLENADLFVGSGGTMTSEAALLGVPTISFDAVPNHYERYVVRSGLAVRARSPRAIGAAARRLLASPRSAHKKRAARARASMVDPHDVLLRAMGISR